MATLRQKKLAVAIVNNAASEEPLNKGKLVESVGYSKITAETKPSDILEAKGVIEELKHLGFSEDAAKRVVGEILLDEAVEPKDRLKASELVFKVSGSFAPEKHENTHVVAVFSSEDIALAAKLKVLERDNT